MRLKHKQYPIKTRSGSSRHAFKQLPRNQDPKIPDTMEINHAKLLQSLYANVFAVDTDLKIVYSNRPTETGETIVESALKREIERAFREKGSFANVEVSSRRDAGRSPLIPLYGFASGHYVEIDGIPLVTVSAVDVSGLHCQTEELEHALEEAQQEASKRTTILQDMSHELKSPLNAVVGFAKLLVQTNDKEKQKKYAEVIETNTNLILSLAKDVLDMARAESGNMTFDYRGMDVNAFMKSMTDMAEMRASTDTIVNCVLGSKNLKLYTAPERLGQVMQNLLNNAVKYTVRGSITAGYEIRNDEVYFFVKDTGTGIPAVKIKHVFDRYWREKKDDFGSGLGLPICKEIIERLGGKIGVYSPGENQGCTFWFTLPLKIDDEVTSDTEKEEILPHKITSVAEEDLPVILIAEDNEGNYMLYEALFEDIFRLLHAWNGAEAVELAKKFNPSLILMDISMPLKDGYEATEEIRKAGLKMPVIAVTAYAFPTDKEKIMSHGFDAYISKPINADELIAAMEKCMDKDSE